MTKKIALIDGYGFVFRAYHSLPPLTRKDQTPVGAVYGFTNMLIKLIASLDVSHLAVVFDAGSKTFRNDIYPEYKVNRPPCPEDLVPQFPIVREAAEALNIAILEKAGFEADDIIATLAKKYSGDDYEVLIVSSDKDLMQLVDDKISMYDAMKNKIIGEKEVFEKFKAAPNRVLDILSLMGDASDNVPGVRGIGPKTAAELIEKFGDLDGIFANLDKIPQKKRRQMLEEGVENAKLSKTLITLKQDVEIGLGEEDLRAQEINPTKLINFLSEQGFRSLVERVKKEFNFSGEIAQENAPLENEEEEISSAVFEEIKKTKIDNDEDFTKLCAKILESENVVIDFEGNLELVTFSTPFEGGIVQEIFYVEIFGEKETGDLFSSNKAKVSSDIFIHNLRKILNDSTVKKIFFDTKSFLRLFLDLFDYDFSQEIINGFEDVALINHLLNSSVKNNFHALVDLNLKDNKFEKIFSELGKSKTPEEFENDDFKQEFYSFKNYGLWQLYKILSPRIFTQKLTNSYLTYEKPLIEALARVENIGVKVDVEKLAKLSQEFALKIKQLTKEIYDIAGEEFNIASTQQLAKILFEKMGLEASKKSKKTGAFSTKSSVLEELDLEGHEIAGKVLEFRKFSKLKNTYTDALPKEIKEKTGRIHSHFSTITTITGRLSSSNPNLQNIPIKTVDGQKIRESFIADKGKILIAADYSQVELRVIAHIAKIDALIEAFKNDKDIHQITAAQVFGIDENEVTKELRSQAKAINFGIIYGISAFGLAKQLKISRQDASKYIKDYLATYPGIEEYMQKYKDFAKENGYVKTIGGRKCFIAAINSSNGMVRAEGERLAINAPIQGSAADIIKKAMINLDKKLAKTAPNAKIILQIHDELIVEADERESEKVAKIIKQEMENAMVLDCPLKVDVEIGKYWQ